MSSIKMGKMTFSVLSYIAGDGFPVPAVECGVYTSVSAHS